MMRHDHRQFRPIPRYELLEPARLKARGETIERSFDAGAVVEFEGYPTSAMRPVNLEAEYAKACAVRRALRGAPDQIDDLAVLARSTGAPPHCCGASGEAVMWLWTWLQMTAAKLKPVPPSSRSEDRRAPSNF